MADQDLTPEEEFNNEELLDALAAFREEQNEKTEQNFTVALLNAVFLAPVLFTEEPTVLEDGALEVAPDTMQLLTFEDEDGSTIFPIFTDAESMAAGEFPNEANTQIWPMTIEEYVPLFENDATLGALALNPFTNGMPITRENLEYLAAVIAATNELSDEEDDDEIAPTSADDTDQDLEISVPENVPIALQYELMGVADDHAGIVSQMYLLWLASADNTKANFLLVVDGPEKESVMALFPEFAAGFVKILGEEDSTVDIVSKEDFDVDLSEFPVLYNTVI